MAELKQYTWTNEEISRYSAYDDFGDNGWDGQPHGTTVVVVASSLERARVFAKEAASPGAEFAPRYFWPKRSIISRPPTMVEDPPKGYDEGLIYMSGSLEAQ